MSPLIFNMSPMTLAEFKTLSWAHLRKVRKSIFLAPFFGVFILAINLRLDNSFSIEKITLFAVIAIISSIILFYSLIFFGINKSIEKVYLNTPALPEGITVTLTENSILLDSQTVNSKNPWPTSYKKAINLKNWVVLSSGPGSAYFLDVTKLQPPSTVADMQALFQRKGINLV